MGGQCLRKSTHTGSRTCLSPRSPRAAEVATSPAGPLHTGQGSLQPPAMQWVAGFLPVGTAILGRSQRQAWFQTLESLPPRRGGGVINSLDSFSPPQAQIPHARPSLSQLVPPRPSSHSLLEEGGKWLTHSRSGEHCPSGPHGSEWPPMNSNCNPATPLNPFVTAVLERAGGVTVFLGGLFHPGRPRNPKLHAQSMFLQ